MIDILAEGAFPTRAGAELVHEVIALLAPQVLPPLFLGPVPSATHPPQTAQYLLFKRLEALPVHETAVRASLVGTYHLHAVGLRVQRVDLSENATLWRATRQ